MVLRYYNIDLLKQPLLDYNLRTHNYRKVPLYSYTPIYLHYVIRDWSFVLYYKAWFPDISSQMIASVVKVFGEVFWLGGKL